MALPFNIPEEFVRGFFKSGQTMLEAYTGAAGSADDANALWIDLDHPTDEEETRVEAALGIDVPTPQERAAIEESARFYQENGALYLTATLLGLLGTFTGMIRAFRLFGKEGLVDPAGVTGGVAEALITTAVGLFAYGPSRLQVATKSRPPCNVGPP